MNLNKVFLIGRITGDINLRATTSNQPVASFSIATNRVWTDKAGQKQEQAEFHNIVVWGRQAELANQFLSKGSLVMIEGRLQTRSWKDKSDQNRKTTEIVCENIQFGPRSASSGIHEASRPQPRKEVDDPGSLDGVPTVDSDEIKPDDLPF